LRNWRFLQTKCYIVNDKERLAQSPDAEEKQEKATEKSESEDAESEAKDALGTLQFTVAYDVDKSTLTVSVICAKNLPVKNATIGTSDPYVKLQLLPEKRQKVMKPAVTKSNLSFRCRPTGLFVTAVTRCLLGETQCNLRVGCRPTVKARATSTGKRYVEEFVKWTI